MIEEYANLAGRYRPRSFSSVVGQSHVVEVLRRAVLADRVPRQLLFSGGSGLGKTTIARIVACALLCETPLTGRERGDACGSCASCRDVWAGVHPDLIEFDAASHGGKDEIREIASRAQVMPLRSTAKVYIIDEAHGLSNPGGQAFLKLLEEPPGHVMFMLCTTDPQRMLKTNRGRCVEFELLPPTRQELADNLSRIAAAEHWTLTEPTLDMVLDASDPDLGVRGTVTTLAKLSTVLADARPPSPDMVASLLGTPSPAVLRQLQDGIASGDRQAGLRALLAARAVSSDGVILDALTEWARREVFASLDRTSDELEIALARLEILVHAQPSTGWLDLAIARLADAGADRSLSQDHPPTPAAQNAPVPASPSASAPGRSAPDVASPPAAGQPVRTDRSSLTAGTDPNASETPTLSADAARLVAAATPVSPDLRNLLTRCQVLISEDAVEIFVPEKMVNAFNPHVPALRTAAGRLGLPLKLKKPQPS